MEVDEAFDLISRAIAVGRAAHGYLICGDLKEACLPLANRILDALFPGCASQLASRSHPDVVFLEPEGKKRIITVKSMRERIVEPMETTSFSGGWKVGFIVSADRMEAPSANAFLKSLEEPSPKTLYLLLTDRPDSILPTIVSRTQRIDLPLSEGTLSGELYEAVASAFAAKSASKLASIFAELKDGTEDADATLVRKQFFKTLMSFVRQMMLSGKLPAWRAFRNIEAVEKAYARADISMNDESVLSAMLDVIVFPKELKK